MIVDEYAIEEKDIASETEDVKKRLRKDEEDKKCQREGYRFGTGSEPMNCFNGYAVYSQPCNTATDH